MSDVKKAIDMTKRFLVECQINLYENFEIV